MSTILERGTDMSLFEKNFDDDDFCHLILPGVASMLALCGERCRGKHSSIEWQGQRRCPCGSPVCPDCIVRARGLA